MAPQRETYPRLLGDLDALSDDKLERPLEEIGQGATCFGRYGEWTDWYHYLLPRLVERRWTCSYYNQAELLFTAFMALYPAGIAPSPYGKFVPDALNTLGQYIMSPRFWPGGEVDATLCLSKWKGPTGIAGWSDAGGLLSASLFFCTKYLPPATIKHWFESVLAISDRYWRVQVLTWLVGAYPILSGEVQQPAELLEEVQFGVTWSWSHILNGKYINQANAWCWSHDVPYDYEDAPPFLPDKVGGTVIQVARDWDAESFLLDFMTDPQTQHVASEITGMPERFHELYRS